MNGKTILKLITVVNIIVQFGTAFNLKAHIGSEEHSGLVASQAFF